MKKVLKAIWNEFIYGGHLAAIGPVIMVLVTCKFLKLRYPLDLLICVYLITYIAYTLDRYLDLKKNKNDPRLRYMAKYQKIFPIILLLSTLAIVTLALHRNFFSLFSATIFIFISFAYNLAFKKLTKIITGFKSFFVALSYSATIFLIIPFTNTRLTLPILLIFLFFFARVLDNTIFCDIKDKTEDKNDKLKTLPVMLTPSKLNILLITINIFSIIPIIYGCIVKILPLTSLWFIIVIFYFFYYYGLSKKQDADAQKIANFWADGELIVWLLIFIGELI